MSAKSRWAGWDNCNWPRDWRQTKLYAQTLTKYAPHFARDRRYPPDDGGIRWISLMHRGTRGTSKAEMDRRLREIQRSL